MDYPREVLQLAEAANAKHSNDTKAASELLRKKACKLPCYDELVETLITRAFLSLIHDVRGRLNERLCRSAGAYMGPAKVMIGLSPTAQQVAKEVYCEYYEFQIDGKRLGDILGKDLLGIGLCERARGDGHYDNDKMCRRLKPLTPADKSVEEAVNPQKLAKIFRECKGKQKAVA